MTAESEQRRWQSLLEHGSDMIVVLDRDGVITYLSRSATRWLGYEPGQLIGQPMLKVVHPDDRNRIAGRLAELVEGSALTFSAECRLGHVDGSWRWTQGLATNLLAQSDLHAVVVNYHDLTERVSAEESLRESQRALTALLGNLPGMVYRCRLDADWTMEFVSQGCADLTGYQPADLIDNRLVAYADLIHPEDREPVWLAVDAAIQADRPYRLEYRIRTARGEDRWVWEQGSAVRGPHGSVVALEGFITDVTERVRTADALRETEAQYRAIFEASSDGLDVTDVATGLVVEANPAFCRMLGYTHQELVGKPASSFIHPVGDEIFGVSA